MSAILMEINVGADFNFPAGKGGLRRSQTTIFKSWSNLVVNEPEVQQMRDNGYARSRLLTSPSNIRVRIKPRYDRQSSLVRS